MSQNPVQQLEQLLEQHPGVLRAAVHKSTDHKFVVQIIPNQDYLNRQLREDGEDRKRLKQWQTVYNWFEKGKSGISENTGLDTSIWNSSYTRKPIPREEMLEWRDLTVQQILSLNPVEVLEIGCGTGPLLLRIAPKTKRYVGIDFSASSLKSIPGQMEGLGGSWDMVSLEERAADSISEFREDSFDTVVMNSVIQCFPSLEYFKRVLGQIIRITKPCGSVFIGDVRNYALSPAFALSVELYRAAPSMSVSELRKLVQKRLLTEREFVASPAFFLALRQHYPEIAGVKILPKLGQFNNELNNFRYDVILQLATTKNNLTNPFWYDWSTQESVQQQLFDGKPEILALSRVPNSRVEKDVAAFAFLAKCPDSTTVDEFRAELGKYPTIGVHPRTLLTLGATLGYQVSFSWASSRPDGSHEVIFCREKNTDIIWQEPDTLSGELSRYVSDPSGVTSRLNLARQLQEYIQGKLVPNELRVDITFVETLSGECN
jgi:ubiquinone/menaquinone biosynthesis C-methylase UbiE